MKLLPINNASCPSCNSVKLTLCKEKVTNTINGKKIKTDWYVYRCNNCQEGFTTTASDEISYKQFVENSKN